MMKKTGLITWAIVLTAVLMCGCSQKKTEDSTPASEKAQNVQETQNVQDTQETQSAQDTQETENTQNNQKTQSAQTSLEDAGEDTAAKSSFAAFDPNALKGSYDISKDKLQYVQIDVKDYGTITAALDETAAPLTVQNFVKLVNKGFYDGLTFHRIMDGFMMQGGDPLGNGTGGSDENVKGEFDGNGVKNPITHVRGAISMARANDPNSASSQFFIVQSDSDFLDGQYAAFGYVTDGMEIVDQICKDAKPTDGNGTIKKEEQPTIEQIRVIG